MKVHATFSLIFLRFEGTTKQHSALLSRTTMVHPSLSMNQCHLYAQKLNNSAALCIEIGQYARAIFSLTKALKLSRAQSDESMLCSCRCKHCTMDGCISYTENSPPMHKIKRQSPAANTLLCDSNSCGYVYRKPIRIPPEPIEDNHNMGRTLFLIITFNLGLAHHLGAITTPTKGQVTTSEDNSRGPQPTNDSNNKMIRKALQLYEISDNWHSRIVASRPPADQDCETAASGIQSIRFRMILANNLSHIHHMFSNHAEQQIFLEHLLSTVMVAVEYQTRANRNSSSDSSSNSNNNEEDSESVLRQEKDLCTTRNLEGFLMNASHLFLCRHCADAA